MESYQFNMLFCARKTERKCMLHGAVIRDGDWVPGLLSSIPSSATDSTLCPWAIHLTAPCLHLPTGKM